MNNPDGIISTKINCGTFLTGSSCSSNDAGWTTQPTLVPEVPLNSPERRLHVDCRLYIGCLAWQNDSSESQALKAWGLSCPKDEMCNTTCRGDSCTTEWGVIATDTPGEYVASDGHTMHLSAHDLPRPPLEPSDYMAYGAAFLLSSMALLLVGIVVREAVSYVREWCADDEGGEDEVVP